MERNIYLDLVEPEVARKKWLDRIRELGVAPGDELIPLKDAHGRVLSRPVEAKFSSPAFHGAAMDGIAVRAQSTFGASPRRPLRLEIGKEAVWINTGRPLPPEMNAVIMIENVNHEGKFAVIERSAYPWQNVRKIGEDMVASEIILPAGSRVGPYELGALAAAGALSVWVHKKAKVAIIPSGSEISPLGSISREDLESGRYLPEYNSHVFSAIIEEAGGHPKTMPIVPDEPDKIKNALLEAAQFADLIILNAGASAGSHDFSSHIIGECGELLCHGISIMPGKPTSLGIISGKAGQVPILGAPGYPVSGITAVEEFAVPLLSYWQNRNAPARRTVTAYPINPLPSRPGMEERVRVKLGVVDDKYYAVGLQRGAGIISSLSRADAIISIPKDSEGVDAGQPVVASLLKSHDEIRNGLMVIGSHDNTLDLLDSLLRRRSGNLRLTSAHVGSLGGILALKAGHCHLATSHLFDPSSATYNKAAIKEYLPDLPVALVRLADRDQGLMVRPGNPLGIQSFADLARPDVSFINRQRGSGTRVLLDYELARHGIKESQINGYREEEYTHMGVAVAVASGRADTGLGSMAAANALGLEFIPVCKEDYDLVIPKKRLSDERIVELLRVIASDEFREGAEKLGGYGLERSGELIWES